jgi:hypothetical protein
MPSPVRQVDIPKPQGGVRTLGIPTLTDRMIQQALHQVLSPIFEAEFSESSYGFRPGRNAHQAVKAAKQYVAEGRRIVVDMDLEPRRPLEIPPSVARSKSPRRNDRSVWIVTLNHHPLQDGSRPL